MFLIDVFPKIPDLATLTDIAIQLKKAPTEENKFVNESDRDASISIVMEPGVYKVPYPLP